MGESTSAHPVTVKTMNIGLTRHSHTHAAQAQDGHKNEGAENSASHVKIMANYMKDWGSGKD